MYAQNPCARVLTGVVVHRPERWASKTIMTSTVQALAPNNSPLCRCTTRNRFSIRNFTLLLRELILEITIYQLLFYCHLFCLLIFLLDLTAGKTLKPNLQDPDARRNKETQKTGSTCLLPIISLFTDTLLLVSLSEFAIRIVTQLPQTLKGKPNHYLIFIKPLFPTYGNAFARNMKSLWNQPHTLFQTKTLAIFMPSPKGQLTSNRNITITHDLGTHRSNMSRIL